MEELEIFLGTDQPTTCPKCGNRTEIIKESEISQQHKCFSATCNFEFVLEFENDQEI